MRTTLAFATIWHLLWAALLVPYAVVIAMVLGGQAAAQDLVDGLAMRFALAVACVAGGLLLNLGLTALVRGVLIEVATAVQVLAAIVIFGVVWFFAIQDLLPYLDLGSGASINPGAPWAALAGGAYGLVLALGLDGEPEPGEHAPGEQGPGETPDPAVAS